MDKVTYTSKDGRFVVEFAPKAQNDLFEMISDFQNVFESENVCGICKGTDISFNVREVEGSKYFEKKCNKPGCYAALPYHQNKKGGTLYRQYKDKWAKYTKPKDEDK